MVFNSEVELPEFKRDFKKLKKKFRTLDEDFEILKEAQLKLYHKLNVDNRGVIPIANLGITYPEIYKVRKFACKSLKGTGVNSGMRLIYAYFPDEDKIEYIEIYYKGDKENENRERIKEYYL